MELDKVEFYPCSDRDPLLEAPLWRYMKIGTLLSMIQQREAFIPTLRKLQAEDPCEGRFVRPDDIPTDIRRELDSDGLLVPWLLKAAPNEWNQLQKSQFPPQFSRGQHAYELVRIMHRELAKRRCVWCWYEGKHPAALHGYLDNHRPENAKIGESMAFWQIYGHNGVAIRSTIKLLVEALSLPAANKLLVCKVRYKNELPVMESASDPQLAYRPMVLKGSSYEHEREVRLVFKVRSFDPDLQRGEPDGIHMELTNISFIQEVVVSPSFPLSEQLGLADLLGKLLPETKVHVSELRNPSHDMSRFTSHNQRECRKTQRFLALESDDENPPLPL